MTEDEAKTKWCPFARVLGTLRQPASPGTPDYVVGQGSQNRGAAMGGPLDNCGCIASACMAWRWSKRAYPNGKVQGQDQGFCGLAGASQ